MLVINYKDASENLMGVKSVPIGRCDVLECSNGKDKSFIQTRQVYRHDHPVGQMTGARYPPVVYVPALLPFIFVSIPI